MSFFDLVLSDGLPHYMDAIIMELYTLYIKGLPVKNTINDVFLSLKIVVILANIADPDGMQPYVAFHMGLHSLSKYLFEKG